MAAMAESRAPNTKVVITDSDNIEHDVSKEVVACRVTELLNEGVDTFAFTLANMKRYLNIFQEHDEVKIYQVDESGHETQILGGNIDVKTKQFPSMYIQFNGREYTWELAEKLTEANKIYLDYEISDIVKDLLGPTSFNTYGVQFGSGAEVTRENFLYHGYPDQDDILASSNVTFNSANYPVDTDSWTEALGSATVLVDEGTENNFVDYEDPWAGSALSGYAIDDAITVHDGDYSIKCIGGSLQFYPIRRLFGSSDHHYWRRGDSFAWEQFTELTFWVYREDVAWEEFEVWFMTCTQTGPVASKRCTCDISGQDADTWEQYTFVPGDFDDIYGTVDDDETIYRVRLKAALGSDYAAEGDVIYIDGFNVKLEEWLGTLIYDGGVIYPYNINMRLSADAGVKQVGSKSIKGTHGSGDREMFYISSKDLALDARGYILKHYIRQDDAGDVPQIRLYTSEDNYFYRTVPIYASNSFEQKEFACGYGEGWSEEGSPDWANINWISWFYSASCIDISVTYIDELHFAAEGNWTLTAITDPTSGDAWTENTATDWDIVAASPIAVSDEGTIKQVNDYSIKGTHSSEEYAVDANTIALYYCNSVDGTTLVDATGNHNGTVNNAAIWNASGKVNGCLYPNNTYYGTIPDHADFTLTGSYTIECYFKLDYTHSNGSGYHMIMDCYSGTPGGWDIRLADDGTCLLLIKHAGGNAELQTTKSSWAANTWFHVAFTCDGSTGKVYVDKAFDRSEGWSYNLDPSVAITIGQRSGAQYKFDGRIDIIRFSDIARTSFPATGYDDREMYYNDAKDLSLNLDQKNQMDFYIRQDDASDDPVLRLYTSAGNFYYRTIAISAADTFERKQYDVGTGSAGWSSTGSPDWSDINYIGFFWAAAQTTVKLTYIDGLHFDGYALSGYIESISFTTVSEGATTELEYFNQVFATLTKTVPAGTTISLRISNDDGVTSGSVTEGLWYKLADHHSTPISHGRLMRYYIDFTGNGLTTPTLNSTDLDVKTIPIKILDYCTFSRESLLSAINKLGEINGSDFFGDWSKNFNFFPENTKSSDITFTEGKNIGFASFATDIKKLKNKIWLYGSKEAYVPRDMDGMTEDNASTWTTSNVSLNDDAIEFKQGEKSIRAEAVFGAGTQWFQEFETNTTNLTLISTGDSTITRDADENLVKVDSSDKYGTAFMYLASNFAAATTVYDISFDFDMTRSTSKGDFCLVCAFTGAPPVRASDYTSSSFDGLIYADPINKKFVYYHHTAGATDLLSNLELPLAANFRIVRAADKSVKIYIDGILVTTKTPDDHLNIQFGECRTTEGSRQNQTYDDLAVLVGAIGGNSCNFYTDNTTYFPLNLNRYKSLDLFVKVNSMGKIEIRLEDDSSNHFKWILYINKAGKWQSISLPVGSDSAGWTTTGTVSWDEINQIRFIVDDTNKLITSFKIDALHFKGRPIIILAEDSASQTAYGVRERVITDESIQRVDFGKEIASTVLSKYKDPLTRGILNTTDLRLVDQGHTVTVSMPSLEVSGTYKVVKCVHNYSASGVIKTYSLDNDFIWIEDVLHSIMTELENNAKQQIEQLREVEV